MSRRLAVLLAALAATVLVLFGTGFSRPDRAAPYLVSLQPNAEPGAAQLFDAAGVDVLARMGDIGVYRVRPRPGTDARTAIDVLSASPLVRAVEPDDELSMQLVPNDPLYQPFQWNLHRIGVEQAWDLRPSAPDMVVAVLDTGVDFAHPDLRSNLIIDQGYDFIDDGPSPQDDESHGTAVAGIIGAVGNNGDGVSGIAWHVKHPADQGAQLAGPRT